MNAVGVKTNKLHSYMIHTSERVVVRRFDTSGSVETRRPLDLVSSIKQPHCCSSSATFVAVRIITF